MDHYSDEMSITLVLVNKDNWEACINLPTSEAHRHVAPNVYSIAEAQFYPNARACCVYAGPQMVGFVMYGPDEDDETMLYIDRLMIAEPYRGQGFGSAVLRHIIAEAQALGMAGVGLSTDPDNIAAIHVYEKVGFRATGERDEDEDIYHYVLHKG